VSQFRRNPLSQLDQQELTWLVGILKDACRERLEKNLISQMLEERLYDRHGPVPGRLDPRARLKQWEPRYRKFLAVATEMQEMVEAAETGALAKLFAERFHAPRPRKKT
jgi:hypothetical protein